jgi:outer membrane protein assembly factor BamB
LNDPAIGPDGTIYGSAGSYTIATNPNGTKRWTILTGGGASSLSVATDGTIYTGNENGRLLAINPDGTIRWVYQTVASPGTLSGGVYTAPTIAPDGTIYIANSRSLLSDEFPPAYLYALRHDGTLKWRYEIPGHTHENKRTGMNQPVVLDRDGTLRWEYVTELGWWVETVPLLVDDGLIWILSPHDSSVHALADPALSLLRAAPGELGLRTCEATGPFTAEVTVSPGGADVAWQAALTTPVP